MSEDEKGREGEDERGRRREGEKEREEHTITNIQQSITKDQQPIAKDQQPIANILFLSNLIESKGVWVLIVACARLKRFKTAFKLVIIGGEGEISESRLNERIEQLGLSEVVSYRGKQYGEEKQQAFAEADIFAFPTWHDCFPLVLPEAMSWSLPVVSTFEGGIPDVVEDGVTGFLVPQRDVAALAAKLETLIGNPALRQQMGAAGRERYEREFTLVRFEERMVEILAGLV
jgi:glycosyltransferase involved in cell wall biosynthesis